MGALLELRGVSKRFGGLVAVDQVDLTVQEGCIWAVIGPNGAGKTTLFNMIAGFYRPTAGEIRFAGADLTRLRSHEIVARGIARTFQNIRLFPRMTALENVLAGQHCRLTSMPWGAVLSLPGTVREERAAHARALDLLEFVGLTDQAETLAAGLPYGAQRRLEIARALASQPRLLMLDEPAAGANPRETDDLIALIRKIRATGVTVLLIEHDMRMVMRVSDGITVLDHGQRIAEGTPQEVRSDPRVIEAYLGTGEEQPAPARRTAPAADGVALAAEDLEVGYGNIVAVKGVSLNVRRGEIVTLIGANGAGKTTTLKTIAGILRPKRGRISLFGERIDGVEPHVVVSKGVASVPEGRQIFQKMTVVENLLMGAYQCGDAGEIDRRMRRVFEVFPRLHDRQWQLGGTLSGGEQQMLAIGRALMGAPRILLLDEPSMGLAPVLVRQIFQIIADIHQQGTTILLVEQNAQMALSVANRGYILQSGRIILEDSAESLQRNESVRKAYLGED